MYIPYTYIVHDTKADKFYIGSKTSKDCTPESTANYMGSPNPKNPYAKVLKERKKDLVKIVIETFNTGEEAIAAETELHIFFSVASNPKFYNMANQTSNKFNTLGLSYRKGKKNSEEHNRKISEWNSTKKVSEETKRKQSATMTGRLWSEERKTAAKGLHKSPEHKRKISEAMKRKWDLRINVEKVE
jgi:hypothetical protein